jgi:DNA-binding MarR family transcriptional regulator
MSLRHEDFYALASFRYAMRKFLRFSKDTLAGEAGLTSEQYEALLALKAFSSPEGSTIRELSERLQVKHHTAVSLVGKLLGRKLISRKVRARDRRQVCLQLTAAGEALLQKIAVTHRKEIRIRSTEMIEALLRLQK